MTSRERWIVYPLLFLTLGIALRDKFDPQFRAHDVVADSVRCERLNVEGKIRCLGVTVAHGDGAAGLRMGLTPAGAGEITLSDRLGGRFVLSAPDADDKPVDLTPAEPYEPPRVLPDAGDPDENSPIRGGDGMR